MTLEYKYDLYFTHSAHEIPNKKFKSLDYLSTHNVSGTNQTRVLAIRASCFCVLVTSQETCAYVLKIVNLGR